MLGKVSSQVIVWSTVLFLLSACNSVTEEPAVDLSPQGVVYYISTGGSDSNSGTSTSRAFRTLSKAATVVRPGDTVKLLSGTYCNYSRFTTNGSASAPITIESASSTRAVVDGPATCYPSSAPGYLLTIDADYYVVRNLIIRNSQRRGLAFLGDNNTATDITAYGNYSDGVYGGGSADFNVYNRIESYNNGLKNANATSGDGIKLAGGNDNTVSYNRIYNNRDDGIDIWISARTKVHHNMVYDNGTCPTSTSCGDGRGLKLGGRDQGSSGVRAYRNISFNNLQYNISTNNSGYVSIYQNVSYDPKRGHYELGNKYSSSSGTNYVKNNIAYLSGVVTGPSSPNNTVVTNNSWNFVDFNPRFLSVNCKDANFLALSTSSSAIDRGTTRINSEVTITGYSGSAPDLGAAELGNNFSTWDLPSKNSSDRCYVNN